MFLFHTLLRFCLFLQFVHSLNHGRNALPGEFPYILRIVISEETIFGDHEGVDEAGRIATGVLLTDHRVLTTCDSVGFFTGQTVNLHNISRVSIMGGSVLKSGKGGQFQHPISSSVHPYCYSLVSGIVLFNYGLYELKSPFDHTANLSPAVNKFTTQQDMEMAMKNLFTGKVVTDCFTAGWGYPRKEFEGRGMPDHFEATSQVLQATTMKVVDHPRCDLTTCQFFESCLLATWETGMVCAEAVEGGPCINDKGAPLICANQVFAIHTNPLKCSDEGKPRHFMRIDLVHDYIYGSNPNRFAANKKISISIIFILTAIYVHFFK